MEILNILSNILANILANILNTLENILNILAQCPRKIAFAIFSCEDMAITVVLLQQHDLATLHTTPFQTFNDSVESR